MWTTAFAKVFHTEKSIVPTLLRIALGVVIFPHGAQKALGWFGGYGYEATMEYFTQTAGLPGFIAFMVIVIEFLGAVALIVGFGGRLAAIGVGIVMVGAIYTTHLPFGFFMNWSGAQPGEGFEYHILALGLAAGVTIAGSGAYSIDRWLARITSISAERTQTQRSA
jgi:putative oxidoreductase